MIVQEKYINVKEWAHSPLSNLAKEHTQEQYEKDYRVGSFIIGGSIRILSLFSYIPASILDLVLSPFINLAIFFESLENPESLESVNQRLSESIDSLREQTDEELSTAADGVKALRKQLLHSNMENRNLKNKLKSLEVCVV